jgi:hypothetical protein
MLSPALRISMFGIYRDQAHLRRLAATRRSNEDATLHLGQELRDSELIPEIHRVFAENRTVYVANTL